MSGTTESLSPQIATASDLAAVVRSIENNIRAVLEHLKAQYRRILQASIDEELFEVVAGYESLSHDPPAADGVSRDR